MRLARRVAAAVLLVLGLFDVPDQLSKARDALTAVVGWVALHGLDQDAWRWAFVISGALIAFGPELFSRLGALFPRSSQSETHITAPPPALPKTRVFVGADVTPKYLMDLYNSGATTLQKKANVASFIGKWMRVEGTVSDIANNPLRIELSEFKGPILTGLDMWFDEPTWEERLSILAHGAKVTVEGQITEVYGISVRLRHCEIVTKAGATPAALS